MCSNGQGVPQSNEEAVKWFIRAAEQWNVNAQYNLGIMYSNGQCVPQLYEEAVRWYRRAAEQGYLNAEEKLKLMQIS